MSRVYFVLCAVAVFLVAIGDVSAHGFQHRRGHGHGHRRGMWEHHRQYRTHVSFRIYDPKGLEVYVRRPNDSAQYFAFEMNINEQNGGSPDVSLNTTEVVYGKYILTDTEVVIKAGDFLNYTWSIGFTNGTQMLQKRVPFRVDPRMIRKNCSCEDVDLQRGRLLTTATPGLTTRHPTTTEHARTATIIPGSQDEDYFGGADDYFVAEDISICDRERSALKAIITSLGQQWPENPKSNFLTLASPQDSAEIEYLQYVRNTLGKSPTLKDLANKAVRDAKPFGNVIVFEMETLVDKLMLLHLCQEAGVTTVKDYD